MDRRSILTKTGKGLMEATGKTSHLPRDLRNVLKEIDGKVSVSALLGRLDKFTEPRLVEALAGLERDGYVREFIGSQDAGANVPVGRAPLSQSLTQPPSDSVDDLDFTVSIPVKAAPKEDRQQAQAQEMARLAQAARVRAEAAAKAEADRARAEAEKKARAEAEQRAKVAADPKAKAELQAKLQTQALDQARREAEERQRRESEEKARLEMEARARVEAEDRAKREAEERQRLEFQEKSRSENEEKARREAEARATRETEERARKQAEERARKEIEEQVRRETEERKIREEVERRSKVEAERARREAEEMERRRREEREHAERMARIDADARAKVEAQERMRRDQEEMVRRELEERGKREEELRLRAAEEARKRKEAQEREARERVARERREAQERETGEREARERKEAQQREARERQKGEEEAARREIEEKIRLEEERESREGEDRARRQAEKAAAEEKAQVEEKAESQAGEAARAKDEERKEREDERSRAREEGRTRKAERSRERAEEESWRGDDDAHERAPARSPADWTRRRSGGLGKQFALMLLILLIIGVAVLPFVPLDSGPYEKAAQEWLGVPVKIGSTSVSLLPSPQLKFEKVAIGEDPPMRVASVSAVPDIGSLTGDRKIFRSLELTGVVFSPKYLPVLLSDKGRGNLLRVQHIMAKGLKLDIPDLDLPPLDVNAKLGADGTVQSVVLVNAERKLSVILLPQGRRASIEISADSFPLPIGGDMVMGEFSAKGTLGPGEMALTEVEGRAFGGRVLGNARLRWSDGWSLDGEFGAKQVEAAKLAAPILAGGVIEGKGVYSMKAAGLGKLFATARFEGNFRIAKGSISNVDMTRVLQGSSTGGGTTLFSEMSGAVTADPSRLVVRQLRLVAGLLSGTGQAEMDSQKNLSGRMQIELRAQTVQARATIALTGTLKDPQFRRSN